MPYSPLELAEAFIKAGELEDARKALDQHLVVNPRDEDAYRLKANLLARSDDAVRWQEAVNSLQNLQSLTPDDVILLSVLLEKSGQVDAALTALDTHYSRHERVAERYVHLLQSIKQFARARRIVAAMNERLPDSWRWLQWAGDLATQDADLKAALDHYTTALALITSGFDIDSDTHMAAVAARLLAARAEIYRQQKALEQAEADLTQAQRYMPTDPVIGFKQGLIAYEKGETVKAVTLCKSALEAASPALRESMLETAREFSPQLYESIN